jgi:glycerol-3-phosphate O-acyltransferase
MTHLGMQRMKEEHESCSYSQLKKRIVAILSNSAVFLASYMNCRIHIFLSRHLHATIVVSTDSRESEAMSAIASTS